MYPDRPGVKSLVNMPAYWASSVLPKEVFMLSLARILCSRKANKTFIPKYIRKASAKYPILMFSNTSVNVIPSVSYVEIYQSSTANIAIIIAICRETFRNRLDDFGITSL